MGSEERRVLRSTREVKNRGFKDLRGTTVDSTYITDKSLLNDNPDPFQLRGITSTDMLTSNVQVCGYQINQGVGTASRKCRVFKCSNFKCRDYVAIKSTKYFCMLPNTGKFALKCGLTSVTSKERRVQRSTRLCREFHLHYSEFH